MSDESPLTVAVIGCGARAQIATHVSTSSVPAHVTMVADPSKPMRVRAAAMFPQAVVVDSVDDVIAAGVDAALILSPDDTHAEIAVALLVAGIAVFVEKPVAITTSDADRVLKVAQSTRTPLYIGHNFRHASVIQTMKSIIDQGCIGQVMAIWVRHFVGNGGDYYYRDWHADRRRTNSLLIQKGCHDIDAIHWLASGYTSLVTDMGASQVYAQIQDRRSNEGLMPQWFSYDHWPPTSLRDLNPVIDVEDISMVHMRLDNAVLASYEQCHFTPDYWRNYTVIGSEGRIENFGDTGPGVVKLWNRRREWDMTGDSFWELSGAEQGHGDADKATVDEFLRYVALGSRPVTSPIAARQAVAVGDFAAQSMRDGCVPLRIPDIDPATEAYFAELAAHGPIVKDPS